MLCQLCALLPFPFPYPGPDDLHDTASVSSSVAPTAPGGTLQGALVPRRSAASIGAPSTSLRRRGGAGGVGAVAVGGGGSVHGPATSLGSHHAGSSLGGEQRTENRSLGGSSLDIGVRLEMRSAAVAGVRGTG